MKKSFLIAVFGILMVCGLQLVGCKVEDPNLQTTITSSTSNPSNSGEAVFAFKCNERNCAFECKLDSEEFTACKSPQSYSGLSSYSHTFSVRAVNRLGAKDSTPASYTWSISFDSWTPTSDVGAPGARFLNTIVWTGNEMIVYGGIGSLEPPSPLAVKYNPLTDTWTPASTPDDPDSLCSWWHSAVWSGNEMLVWGGYSYGGGEGGEPCKGGRYNPSTDSWALMSSSNAPSARQFPLAFWTGKEMLILGGGYNDDNTGGKYNPLTDSWAATSTINAPAPSSPGTAAVWTGTYVIVWDFNQTHHKYNPESDVWSLISTVNQPEADLPEAVWTGTEMIVWSSLNAMGESPSGKYNPITDSWTEISSINRPSSRSYDSVVWTGTEMIVWGGQHNFGGALDTGGKYNPLTDSWTATSTVNAPEARAYHTGAFHTAVWTGSEMIVWGGLGYEGEPLTTGGRYKP